MAKAPSQHKRPTIGKAATHKRSARHAPRERRGSSTSRGYDYRWEKFAKLFIRRNPLCEYCMVREPNRPEPAAVCDHDLPHEKDPELFWNNTFTALCVRCHSSVKQRMERRYKGEALLAAILVAKGQT